MEESIFAKGSMKASFIVFMTDPYFQMVFDLFKSAVVLKTPGTELLVLYLKLREVQNYDLDKFTLALKRFLIYNSDEYHRYVLDETTLPKKEREASHEEHTITVRIEKVFVIPHYTWS
jgi:hypothetical protein